MSYGSPSKCIAEEQQILRAIKLGAVPVAASGNEFENGNPLEFPASLAHVITVGAIGPDDKPTGFSNESAAVDLSAPGIGILTGVPAAFDPDGTRGRLRCGRRARRSPPRWSPPPSHGCARRARS